MRRQVRAVWILALCLIPILVNQTTARAERQQQGTTLIADIGFRPEVNGFPFENYGPGYSDLTPYEVRRIFGDEVCGEIDGDSCILTFPAQQWMEQTNNMMAGGHCYGFSVASLMFFSGQETPDTFGSDAITNLNLRGNVLLQNEIAYAFAQQFLESVLSQQIDGTPVEILEILAQALKENPDELYTIGIRARDGQGGHAVTPFAIEDRGNGIAAILIYDNNWPGLTREILVDQNANTWQYEASTNPAEQSSLYEGDAETLTMSLLPFSPGLGQQTCPFCGNYDEGTTTSQFGVLAKQAANAPQYNQIYLHGNPQNNANLLITDAQGQRLGSLPDGKLVNEIPGARIQSAFTGDLWNDHEEPVYYIPVGIEFTIVIDGTPLTTPDKTDVVMIGHGYTLGVFDIALNPGQTDALNISSDGSKISYGTYSAESPLILIGIQNKGADYQFAVMSNALAESADKIQVINVGLDLAQKALKIDANDSDAKATYGLYMSRIGDNGEQEFSNDGLELDTSDSMYVLYDNWTGQGGTLDLGLDQGNDGTIDEHVSLTDEDLAVPQ